MIYLLVAILVIGLGITLLDILFSIKNIKKKQPAFDNQQENIPSSLEGEKVEEAEQGKEETISILGRVGLEVNEEKLNSADLQSNIPKEPISIQEDTLEKGEENSKENGAERDSELTAKQKEKNDEIIIQEKEKIISQPEAINPNQIQQEGVEKDIRIGLFLCACGPNISEAIDLAEVKETFSQEENLVCVEQSNLLCSKEGKEFIKNKIKELKLNRVVIAACSPKEHEATFRSVLESAGLNPFLLQIANIREQCAWIIKDKSKATQRAKEIIRAALRRVRWHIPLKVKEISACPDVVIVGAGVAGMKAALTLAGQQRKVYLIEKDPFIGGRVVRYEDVFPHLECAPCMLEPVMDEVLHHPNIEVLTQAEISEVLGFYGNFTIKVIQQPRYVNIQACIGCGACIQACPQEQPNPWQENRGKMRAIDFPFTGCLPNAPFISPEACLRFKNQECDACFKACPFGAVDYGQELEKKEIKAGAILLATGFDVFDPRQLENLAYGKIKDVYTAMEFERMLSASGFTNGKVITSKQNPPEKIVFLNCVGSCSEQQLPYCSEVCCRYVLKFALLASHKLPGVKIVFLHKEWCVAGKDSWTLWYRLKKNKVDVDFVRIKDISKIKVKEEKNKLQIIVQEEPLSSINADMLVLATAIKGVKDNIHLAQLLDLEYDKYDFFKPQHKLSSTKSMVEGIFIAGGAQRPLDIQSTAESAVAAAGEILSCLIPGEKIKLEPCVAEVDEDKCSGCKSCIAVCPYRAISYDQDKKKAYINSALCRGCGTCVALCPSAAITAYQFTDKQIIAEVIANLE